MLFCLHAYVCRQVHLGRVAHLDQQQRPQVIHHLAGQQARIAAGIQCGVNGIHAGRRVVRQHRANQCDYRLAGGSPKYALRQAERDFLSGRCHLVEQRDGIPHPAGRLPGDQRQSFRLGV